MTTWIQTSPTVHTATTRTYQLEDRARSMFCDLVVGADRVGLLFSTLDDRASLHAGAEAARALGVVLEYLAEVRLGNCDATNLSVDDDPAGTFTALRRGKLWLRGGGDALAMAQGILGDPELS